METMGRTKRPRRSFTKEFKAEVVDLVRQTTAGAISHRRPDRTHSWCEPDRRPSARPIRRFVLRGLLSTAQRGEQNATVDALPAGGR